MYTLNPLFCDVEYVADQFGLPMSYMEKIFIGPYNNHTGKWGAAYGDYKRPTASGSGGGKFGMYYYLDNPELGLRANTGRRERERGEGGENLMLSVIFIGQYVDNLSSGGAAIHIIADCIKY